MESTDFINTDAGLIFPKCAIAQAMVEKSSLTLAASTPLITYKIDYDRNA
jgi:hypothetical protein